MSWFIKPKAFNWNFIMKIFDLALQSTPVWMRMKFGRFSAASCSVWKSKSLQSQTWITQNEIVSAEPVIWLCRVRQIQTQTFSLGMWEMIIKSFLTMKWMRSHYNSKFQLSLPLIFSFKVIDNLIGIKAVKKVPCLFALWPLCIIYVDETKGGPLYFFIWK